MSNRTAEYMLPRIIEDLKARHPEERDNDRIALAASYIYSNRAWRTDEWGRLQYHDSVRALVPRCFPAPKFGVDPESTCVRWGEGKIGHPVDLHPAPRPVDPRFTEADELAAKYEAIIADAEAEAYGVATRHEPAADHRDRIRAVLEREQADLDARKARALGVLQAERDEVTARNEARLDTLNGGKR